MKRITLTNETPRQTLIVFAAAEMRVHGITAHEAIESVVDGAQPGTLGGAMREYYLKAALERLIRAVEREAR